jgi:hypothetical protein
VSVILAHLAARLGQANGYTPAQPGAHELVNAAWLRSAVGCEWREPLVGTVVPVQDDIAAVLVEEAPERPRARRRPVLAGREPRMMPVREHARLRLVLRSCSSHADCGGPASHPPTWEQLEWSD